MLALAVLLPTIEPDFSGAPAWGRAVIEAAVRHSPILAALAGGGVWLIVLSRTAVAQECALGVAIGATWLLVLTLSVAMNGEVWNRGDGAPGLESVLVVAAILVVGAFSFRKALFGFTTAMPRPRRVRGKRAVHGEADWLPSHRLSRLFPSKGGIVLGEWLGPVRSDNSSTPFRPNDPSSWGKGGRSPLICFDCSFGSTHGLVFAGSGGFMTSSVTIPTALSWPDSLVVLDPSGEVLPMVGDFRRQLGRVVIGLDPARPEFGFNALDWIGQSGGAAEEDIVAVASWIIPQSGRTESIRDDFFRGAAVQLLTALIADVCLSGHTEPANRTLRQVRINLAEPEPRLRERLQAIYDQSASPFVRENVAPFINMTPETFSGVYASAAKETHWLSYDNYASLVSGSSLRTDQLANGGVDIFINLDLHTLESHPGLARVIVGSLSQAIFNRRGKVSRRTLFLLDEAARLGYMKILEIARDAGRKYGLTLVLMFQSLGQLREAYGGRDATSKWFESASWVSFAAINDLETAEYVSRRCGAITVEVEQLTKNGSGASRSRSLQLTRRDLISPDEVLAMRADEQIIFSPGNAPIWAGRAIYFRRAEMVGVVGQNPYRSGSEVSERPSLG